MLFTDYYAEASCTAGRASFITGEIPLRTGLTTVGQAGAKVGMPDKACTIATALKAQGYATGQFGKNHLGDLNQYLPTLHGFDEFFGYLYHLDAMSDPFWYSYPSDPVFQTYGPRNLVHSWATDADDATVDPRWGKVGKQKVEDKGPLPPLQGHEGRPPNWQAGPPGSKYDMETSTRSGRTLEGIHGQGQEGGQAFLPLAQHDAHARLHGPRQEVSGQDELQDELRRGRGRQAQLDDSVGAIMKHLEDIGEADNTLLVFSTDNGAEVFTWPDGGMTPFKGTKGTVMEGGFRARASPAGPARSSRAASRTASSPAWTGSPPWSPPPATRTSRPTSSKG